MGNTSHFRAQASGFQGLAQLVYGNKTGVGTVAAKLIYMNSAHVLVYSTPTVSVGNTGTVNASGASSAGTASATVTASPGGNSSGSLSYSYSMPSGFYISAGAGTTTPTVSSDFTGVGNGTTSSPVGPSTASCTVTDTVTGATYTTTFTVGPYTWQNTIPAFAPFTATDAGYSGSGSYNGPPHQPFTFHWTGTLASPVIPATGGPVDFANLSYSWSITGQTGGSGATLSNATTATPTVNSTLIVPPGGNTRNDIVTLQCVFNDTHNSYTLTGVTATFTGDNNS